MKAAIGDTVRIKGHHLGTADRIGKIIDVQGAKGAPPYLVKFTDGHQTLLYPGPDCHIEPTAPRA